MKELNLLRKEIDEIDKKLIEFFIKRMNVSQKIGDFKKKNSLPIYNPKREEEIIAKYKNINLEYGDYIEDFLKFLMKKSKEVQAD